MLEWMKAASRGLIGLILIATGTPAIAQPGGNLVQPESLAQGFTIVVRDKTGLASDAEPIYLASNHVNWNPGDPSMRLTRRSDGLWQIELPKPRESSRLAFKFTRGDWDRVEVAGDLGDIENRVLEKIDLSSLAPGQKPIIRLTIERWADERPSAAPKPGLDPTAAITVTGTLRRVQVVGGGVDIVRDLLVWLPPGYDDPGNAARRYPVLYLQDGQNIFDAPPGVPGEWHADETATRLIRDGTIEPIIIVGIPHAGKDRSVEYLPMPVLDGVPARGDRYVDFLVREVKPRIDRVFRTKPGAEFTGIGGSSFGAVIAMEAGSLHPDLFGMVLAESPAVLAGGEALLRHFQAKTTWPARVYIGMGENETGVDASSAQRNEAYVQAAQHLYAMLGERGVSRGDRMLVIGPDAVHNERAWAQRLPGALTFLFPVRD